MDKTLLSVLLAALLFASCAGNSSRRSQNFTADPEAEEAPGSFIITDYKNKSTGEKTPEWVELWLNSGNGSQDGSELRQTIRSRLASGIHRIETLDEYQDRYVFISWNEGSNFNALTQWTKGFSAELDFPRLAAARIEARLIASVPFPDDEYGSFFETLIRAASDSSWTGAVKEDDFWILRSYLPGSGEYETPLGFNSPETEGRPPPPPRGAWEFLILVTINKTHFAAQLDDIFRRMNPRPTPSRDQINAANRVKEHFFDDF